MLAFAKRWLQRRVAERQAKQAGRRKRRLFALPILETMEQRIVPSTIVYWKGATNDNALYLVGGNSTGRNWVNAMGADMGRLPQAGDTINFGNAPGGFTNNCVLKPSDKFTVDALVITYSWNKKLEISAGAELILSATWSSSMDMDGTGGAFQTDSGLTAFGGGRVWFSGGGGLDWIAGDLTTDNTNNYKGDLIVGTDGTGGGNAGGAIALGAWQHLYDCQVHLWIGYDDTVANGTFGNTNSVAPATMSLIGMSPGEGLNLRSGADIHISKYGTLQMNHDNSTNPTNPGGFIQNDSGQSTNSKIFNEGTIQRNPVHTDATTGVTITVDVVNDANTSLVEVFSGERLSLLGSGAAVYGFVQTNGTTQLDGVANFADGHTTLNVGTVQFQKMSMTGGVFILAGHCGDILGNYDWTGGLVSFTSTDQSATAGYDRLTFQGALFIGGTTEVDFRIGKSGSSDRISNRNNAGNPLTLGDATHSPTLKLMRWMRVDPADESTYLLFTANKADTTLTDYRMAIDGGNVTPGNLTWGDILASLYTTLT